MPDDLDPTIGCVGCGGRGWHSRSDHHPACDGSCALCPVEVQVECECRATPPATGLTPGRPTDA